MGPDGRCFGLAQALISRNICLVRSPIRHSLAHDAFLKRTIADMQITPVDGKSRVRFQSLASGSSGNAYLLQVDDAALLIDCGIGYQQIRAALHSWGLTEQALALVLISHEHTDHVRALETLVRHRVQVAATQGTATALGISAGEHLRLRHLESISVAGCEITPLPISHDAREPNGLLITTSGITIGIMTDLGEVTEELTGHAACCDLIVLESNHDRLMLRDGPYPSHLKRRVASKHGHLSNDQAADVLQEVVRPDSRPSEIWLGHLSATNNTPALALSCARDRLRRVGIDLPIAVLPRGHAGPVWAGAKPRVRQLQLLAE